MQANETFTANEIKLEVNTGTNCSVGSYGNSGSEPSMRGWSFWVWRSRSPTQQVGIKRTSAQFCAQASHSFQFVRERGNCWHLAQHHLFSTKWRLSWKTAASAFLGQLVDSGAKRESSLESYAALEGVLPAVSKSSSPLQVKRLDSKP